MAQEGRTALDLALVKDHEETASLLRLHNALKGTQLKEHMTQVKQRMDKEWRDAGNVVVLEHVVSDTLYEDNTMVFEDFNTFKTDVKLSAGKVGLPDNSSEATSSVQDTKTDGLKTLKLNIYVCM